MSKKSNYQESSLRSNLFADRSTAAPLELRTIVETLVLGFILGITGFVLLGYSEGINIESQKIQQLRAVQAEELNESEGLVKITGVASTQCTIIAENCTDNFLYKKTVREELLDEQWTTVQVDESYAYFSLAEIKVIPENADFVIIPDIKARNEGTYDKDGSQIKYRETIYGIADTQEVLVVGNIKESVIAEGSIFLITNKTNKQLLSDFKEETIMQWWLFKLAALLLLTLGLTAFVLPIILFLDLFPGFEILVSFMLFFLGAIVSFLFVFLTTLFIAYWWVILVVVLFVLLLLINLRKRKLDNPISFIPNKK